LFRVKDTPAFRTWFGPFDNRKAAQVGSVIQGFKGQLRCKSHVFYTDLGRCEDDTLAWYIKHPDPKQLSIANYCPSFFSLPDNGTDSKWGTILHELSHGYGGTVDHAYGQARCRQLAVFAPHLAVENADSYQYYLEEEA
jgi:peptidyl-Lys metalloendopeptidase